jgi:acyl-CoA thioester hydrolase
MDEGGAGAGEEGGAGAGVRGGAGAGEEGATGAGGRWCHHVRVRYGEVDMQRVVFNAHYLAYCDDATESWLQALGVNVFDHGWDFMLKRATIEWQGTATVHEVIDIGVGIDRWGTTSFEVGFNGRVGERQVFRCTITYVGVSAGTRDKMAVPAHLRAVLGDAGAPA